DEQLRACVILLEKEWSTKGLDMELDLEPVRLDGDQGLLEHLWINLIGNAVKYGRDRGEVRVTVQQGGTRLRVEVWNQGVGVPPEALPHLFRKFYRVQDPVTSGTKGTGVGLYLVRRFIELHGGEVAVEGEYGSWIAFSFTIPNASPRAVPPDGAPAPAETAKG
ncbi:MAG TPA: ATP-binding protein, partial [Thermoanaerobaculales bacterium]|nr:ATP-binding protein [Thermoanaerobaculales bacterium]